MHRVAILAAPQCWLLHLKIWATGGIILGNSVKYKTGSKVNITKDMGPLKTRRISLTTEDQKMSEKKLFYPLIIN